MDGRVILDFTGSFGKYLKWLFSELTGSLQRHILCSRCLDMFEEATVILGLAVRYLLLRFISRYSGVGKKTART